MQLPAGWVVAGSQESGQEIQYEYQAFSPAAESDVLLWFFYRGYFLPKGQGKRFREILDKPPHALGPDEIEHVAQVIRDKSKQEDFKLFTPRTENLNGKVVLVIEGRYIEAQEDAYSIYVDGDGSGRLIRELHYRAPRDQFLRYLASARKAFRSIVWKDAEQG